VPANLANKMLVRGTSAVLTHFQVALRGAIRFDT
jgi:hypothetical protein